MTKVFRDLDKYVGDTWRNAEGFFKYKGQGKAVVVAEKPDYIRLDIDWSKDPEQENPYPTNFYHKLRAADGMEQMIDMCAEGAKQWWKDPVTGEPIDRNTGEILMLIVSEIAEAMEGARKDLMDDHLPHRKMEEVELADAVIRIFDYAKVRGYDLPHTMIEKMDYNKQRADHKLEARLSANGKKW